MSTATDANLLAWNQEKLAAETKAALALAALNTAQARKADAEATSAALDGEAKAVAVEEMRREQLRESARNDRHHVYLFNGAVDRLTVAHCINALTEWSRLDPRCDIEIVFNSPGGSVIEGMALWDFLHGLRTKGHTLTTVARGYAASMAGILLQAGDHRVIGSESYLMIHELSAGTSGKIGEIQDAVKFYEMISRRVLDIFVTRSNGKISKANFTKSWTRIDWWIDSAEALKLGFVDEVR